MPDALLPVGVLGAPLMPELHLELELLQLELELLGLLELELPPPPPLLGAARRLSSSTSLAWQRGDRPAADAATRKPQEVAPEAWLVGSSCVWLMIGKESRGKVESAHDETCSLRGSLVAFARSWRRGGAAAPGEIDPRPRRAHSSRAVPAAT